MTRKSLFIQRSQISFLIPALLVLILNSCSKPSIGFGNSFASNQTSTNVVAIDTFGVKMSTVLLDSFPTSATGTSLVGSYQDPFLGKVSSSTYFEIGPPQNLPTFSNLDVYDSLVLVMRINKSFYGDTTQTQRYNVSQLTSLLDFPNNQTVFFSNNLVPFNPSILGSTDVKINPTGDVTSQRINDTVKIRLPDAIGNQFFGLLFNQSDTVKNASTFRAFFKGLVVYPDNASVGSIYGFKDSIFARLYFHSPGLVQAVSFIDFPYTNNASQFNHIDYNRASSPSAPIDSIHSEIASESTGNAAFEQTATGLYTKLLFPTISKLLQYQDYLSILRAELTIRPVQGTYSPIYNLPPQINLALTTEGNNIGTLLNNGTGNLSIDYLAGANTTYTYDVTAYIKQQIALGPDVNSKEGLILTLPTTLYNTTFNRAIFGNQLSSSNVNKISLKIYYASF